MDADIWVDHGEHIAWVALAILFLVVTLGPPIFRRWSRRRRRVVEGTPVTSTGDYSDQPSDEPRCVVDGCDQAAVCHVPQVRAVWPLPSGTKWLKPAWDLGAKLFNIPPIYVRVDGEGPLELCEVHLGFVQIMADRQAHAVQQSLADGRLFAELAAQQWNEDWDAILAGVLTKHESEAGRQRRLAKISSPPRPEADVLPLKKEN